MMTGNGGFALPIALILAAAMALLAADALLGASTASAAAGSARLRQRAFDAAETGLARTLASLDADVVPPDSQTMSLTEGATAEVYTRLDGVDSLVEGFSAGRVSAERYSIVTRGRSNALQSEDRV